MRASNRFVRLFSCLGFLLSLTACASTFSDLPAGTVKEVTGTAVVSSETVSIPTFVDATPPDADYRVGTGDVLYVNVQSRPDLGSPISSASELKGTRIDGRGQLHLPLVGVVKVDGLTLAEVEKRLTEAYAPFLQRPWIVVEIAEYRSHPLYLIGQFRNAGTYYMDRPMTLLQGVSEGDGLLDSANLRSARLLRDKKTMPVDLLALLEGGDVAQNVWLQGGDTIYVPDDKNQNVFVFGAVTKPGPVVMPNGSLTLSQALAAANLNDVRGHIGFIRIIRSYSPVRGELLVVDLDAILRGEALPFTLTKGDVIYVPRSRIGNWNETVTEILPSLQLFSALLQPFVQIKYLTDSNN
jgi:polysaccharide export outer membrane protein